MKRNLSGPFYLLLPLFLLSACSPIKPSVDSDKPYEFIRGAVIKDDDGFTITPCFSQTKRQLVDTSGLLSRRYNEQSPTSRLPVYMELWAYQQVDLAWNLYGVNLAGGGSKACDTDLRNVEYRAGGVNPVWVADVFGDHIRVEIIHELRSMTFPISESPSLPFTWQSSITGIKGRTHDLEMQFRRQTCRDAVGAWYPLVAEVNLDGKVLKGCAREGDLMSRSIPGRYSNDLAPDESFVVLDLLVGHQAKLLVDYRNGQPLSILEGNWQLNKSGRLELNFVSVNGLAQQTILVMQRSAKGALVPYGYSEIFGNASLALERSE